MTRQKLILYIKVKVPKNPMEYEEKIVNGFFHQWRNSIQMSESAPDFQVTISIVKLEDGVVNTYKPSQIKFVYKF